MIAAWMLVALVLGALVAAAAACAAGLAVTRRWPVRWAWAAGLATLVALVALAPWRRIDAPGAMPEVVATEARGTKRVASTDDAPPLAAVRDAAGALRTGVVALVARAASLPVHVQRTLGGAWVLTSCLLLATLALTWRRVIRATRVLPLAQLHGTTVRIAPDGAPTVVGIRAPQIVIPTWALALPDDARALVLAHERAHRDAHDPALLVAAAVAVALLPWHPVVWWLASRLATAIEIDCDTRVLAGGVPVRRYGALLVDVAATRCVTSPLAPWPALGGRRSSLETRIRAMTTPQKRYTVTRSSVLAVAGGALMIVACDSASLPTAAEVARIDAASAAQLVRGLPTSASTKPTVYLVDGVAVTSTEANAIQSEAIASISVHRNGFGDTSNVVRIATHATGAPIDRATQGGTGEAPAVLRARGSAAPARVQGSALPPLQTPSRGLAPLYYIDGVRADTNTIRSTEPDRIVSVEVIKGTAATATYGADAAAGVIRITTKRTHF